MQDTPVQFWVGNICWRRDRLNSVFLDFPCDSAGKESAFNLGDLGSIPGWGRSPGEGNSYTFQYSGLQNSMDCIVHGVAKSWTWLSNFHFTALRELPETNWVMQRKHPGAGNGTGIDGSEDTWVLAQEWTRCLPLECSSHIGSFKTLMYQRGILLTNLLTYCPSEQ